jgi:hypothetical protein
MASIAVSAMVFMLTTASALSSRLWDATGLCMSPLLQQTATATASREAGLLVDLATAELAAGSAASSSPSVTVRSPPAAQEGCRNPPAECSTSCCTRHLDLLTQARKTCFPDIGRILVDGKMLAAMAMSRSRGGRDLALPASTAYA